MNTLVTVSVMSIALLTQTTYGMRGKQIEASGMHTHKPAVITTAHDGTRKVQPIRSKSEIIVSTRVISVLKTEPDTHSEADFRASSPEDDNVEFFDTLSISSQIEPEPRTAYPIERLNLGLQVEWLYKLPLEKIYVVGFDPAHKETVEQNKEALVAHLRAAHAAVKHNLDDDNDPESLAVDLSKLIPCPKGILAPEKSIREQHEITPPALVARPEAIPTPKEPDLESSEPLFQSLGTPIATGMLGLVLGYVLARK